ncbi:hypothetical protein TGPRC2_201900B, partial [Toxoplasma gondii TgCatPRC2]
VSGCLL